MGMQKAEDEAQPKAVGAVRGRGAKQWLWLGCDPRFAPDLTQAGYIGLETMAVDIRTCSTYTCLLPPAGRQPFCSPNNPSPG